MAQSSKLVIVPDKPNDVSGVLTTALRLSSEITKGL